MNTPVASLPLALLVDDDRELTAMLAQYLSREGFATSVLHDGRQALETLVGVADPASRPDIVILDVMLPGMSGLDVLRGLRSMTAPPPVLMLTARGDDVDRIHGLELGADDYLAKPFNPRELVARLRAILRRVSDRAQPDEPITLGRLRLDPARQSTTLDGQPVDLTAAEFRVLDVLVRAAGRVVSRESLTELALGRKLELYDRSIDTHISNLRRKLRQGDTDTVDIRGIRGAGYLLAPPTSDPAP